MFPLLLRRHFASASRQVQKCNGDVRLVLTIRLWIYAGSPVKVEEIGLDWIAARGAVSAVCRGSCRGKTPGHRKKDVSYRLVFNKTISTAANVLPKTLVSTFHQGNMIWISRTYRQLSWQRNEVLGLRVPIPLPQRVAGLLHFQYRLSCSIGLLGSSRPSCPPPQARAAAETFQRSKESTAPYEVQRKHGINQLSTWMCKRNHWCARKHHRWAVFGDHFSVAKGKILKRAALEKYNRFSQADQVVTFYTFTHAFKDQLSWTLN